MTSVTRTISAPPERVWEVLADGWLYPLWVVGTIRIRDVDRTWPAVGSCIHHSLGLWPAVINDTTEIVESEPCRVLGLRVRAWVLGEARVEIHLSAVPDGTEVVMAEQATAGPAALMPTQLSALPLTWRNVETLRRLASMAERRA